MNKNIDIDDASRRASELLRRVIISQAIMTSALEIPKASDALKQTLLRDHLAGKTGLKALSRRLKPAEEIDPTQDFEKLAQGISELEAINGEMVIAAAVIVLSHSMADDVFAATCALAIELDPSKWIPELNRERKVSLGTLRDIGMDAVFLIELTRFRNQLAGRSLPNRAELLFRRVRIDHHTIVRPQDPTYFKLSTLKEADDLRIEIVHGSGLPKIDLERSKNTALFLHEAALTAVRSLANAYALVLDFDALLKRGSQKEQ